MKIGIFTELYLPHVGGQEIRYAELAACFQQLGHTVDVYCIRHSADVASHEVLSGISVSRYPLAPGYEKPLFKPLKRAVLPLLRYSLWVRQMARADKYDIMLFNQWPLAHIVFSRKSAREKAILDWCEVRDGRVDRQFQKWLPKLAARNIAVSHGVAEAVSAVSGRRVDCVPSGVWLSNYRCEPKERRSGLVYLGRVTEHKNLALLVEAFERMKDEGYLGGLTIAGGGPSLAALTDAAKASRYGADIHLPGFVDDETKVDLLSKSEVLVIASRREGFPRVVAEAMASGLPVATVNFPENGTKSVVQRYGIGAVSEPSAAALSQNISELLGEWDRYSENCRKRSHELDWSLLVGKLLEPIKLGITTQASVAAVLQTESES